MATEVVMPQMGESIAEGTITKWLKSVGEHVDSRRTVVRNIDRQVDAEIPSPAAGTLTEVRYKEGETVEVNTVVAVLDGNAAAPPAKEETVASPAAAPPVDTARADAAPPPSQSAPPRRESPATVETPKPAITAPVAHKTEVKPLVKKGDAANVKAAPAPERTGDGATAAELRRTKSSPLVRKIASEHNIDIQQLEGTG